jgi:hypothetical protein
VMYYAKEGIYFNHAWEAPGPGPGLWLLDLTNGIVQTVFTDKSVDAVGEFAAWLAEVNPGDPHPVFSETGVTTFNRVLRRDLNGGPTVTWFYRPGQSVAVIGFDQSKQPLILASDGQTEEIWRCQLPTRVICCIQAPTSHGLWPTAMASGSLTTRGSRCIGPRLACRRCPPSLHNPSAPAVNRSYRAPEADG